MVMILWQAVAWYLRRLTYTQYGPIKNRGVRARGDAAVHYRTCVYNSSSPSSKFAILRFSAREIWRVFSIKNLVYCFVCPGLILQNWNQVEIQYSYAMTADSDFLFDKSLLRPVETVTDFLIELGRKPCTYASIGNNQFFTKYKMSPSELPNLWTTSSNSGF